MTTIILRGARCQGGEGEDFTEEMTTDGPDDMPPRHALPFALVMERKKATPIGTFDPELRTPFPACHAVTEPNGRIVLAK